MNLRQLSKYLKKKRNFLKCVVCAIVLWCTYDYFGIGDYLHASSFENDFHYPLDVNIKDLVNEVLSNQKLSVTPINYYPYSFLSNSGKCTNIEKIDLMIVVKSAMDHFGHRDTIRKTYGNEDIPGRTVKILFFLGVDGKPKSDVQRQIDQEMADFHDIIQMDFIDYYYNNTIKTMMSFRWVYEHCSHADYYLFTDDDMYISVNNLLGYLHDRLDASSALQGDLLFTGYVFHSAPQRFRFSKWRVSLEEYRWDRWPDYVTAAAYVLSNKAMRVMYIGSLFVKHFRFDDIYLGIVAKKVGITPEHCPHFYFHKKKFSLDAYEDVIASHGYHDHDELIRVWHEMNCK
ncbi:beta-1,3-galactosyltransferase brn-like [Spodoptera litura]|uniref:Hexosyltransferase n=1 Tax=Spodoptera litura TaxID=69820 RepID=A0A9J7EM50_SPOLT|nr:beta-1,3-galactosyltransferase brn-like [Spodoptera litura]XP_022830508.1 beta-1,3-galactosyltransferase brn-like [Spodoptera litura]